jgi:hypothetical protein
MSTNPPRSSTSLNTGKALLFSDILNSQSVIPAYMILHELYEIVDCHLSDLSNTGLIYFAVNVCSGQVLEHIIC